MVPLKFLSRILHLVPVLLLLVGCATMEPTATGYIGDPSIAAAVKARLTAADPYYSRVGVTSQNGVVYLTGTVDSPARASQAIELARTVNGVQSVVSQVQVAATPPPAVTVITSPAPPAASAIVPGHPPVEVSGTVASYDAQTGIATLTDGRIVRVRPGMVWQPAPSGLIQPGTQIYARNAEPIGMQAPIVLSQPSGWRMGTVDRVDTANGLMYLRDGTVVRVAPSTTFNVNGQMIRLAQVQPGTQVAVRTPGTAPAEGQAFPRATPVSLTGTEVLIFP